MAGLTTPRGARASRPRGRPPAAARREPLRAAAEPPAAEPLAVFETYIDREWRFLTNEQRSDARRLGFPGEQGWNDDDEAGWASTPCWAGMSDDERQAAGRLQFDAESWWGPPPWDA